ncbi:MAG: A24 family peptidase [Negativicutes bacterium]|nr:A24 family peptidase [Negativicutes bacterium]
MKELIFAVLGGGCGFASYHLMNLLPAAWFSEIDEAPHAALQKTIRWPRLPWLPLSCLLLAVLAALIAKVYAGILFPVLNTFALLLLWMIALSDARFSIIPDQFCIGLAGLGVLRLMIVNTSAALWAAGIGLAAAAFLPWLVGCLWSVLRHQEALGFGDVKLLAALAIYCGWPDVGLILFITLLTAGLTFGILLLLKRLHLGDSRPIGPYICLAAALWLLFRPQLLNLIQWYLSLIRF